jgi:hypothetical protein
LDDGDDERVGVASGVASSAARKNNTTMFGASRKDPAAVHSTVVDGDAIPSRCRPLD